jgi:murein tripeptide amidase MpaA
VQRPIIYLQAGIHALEWITPAALQYFVDDLVTQWRAGDPEIRALLRTVEFIVVPVANPDGYAYTHLPEAEGGNRLWRKNKRDQDLADPGSRNFGVDLNRNFDQDFDNGGNDERQDTNAAEYRFFIPSFIVSLMP